MPEVSRFYGISIKLYYGDHSPPHFHAEYAGDQQLVSIDNLTVIAGKIPPRAAGMVAEWASLRQAELRRAWQQARNLEPIDRIDPLP